MNFYYATFMNEGWQKVWVIICDECGNPVRDVKTAKKTMQLNYPNQYWGIANYQQMLLNNAMQDNI